MIPKIIHYCWFGRNPKPELALKCIQSWKRHCLDYQIVEWNEDNFDLSVCPLYVRQAYSEKKWAFVTDYVRLKVVYDHGGIYMDTDVELKKNLDCLLKHNAYFGFEDSTVISTGLGFGAIKGFELLREMMSDYESTPFILPSGELNTIPCPQVNTGVFLKHGLLQNGKRQILEDNILILPEIYLNPLSYATGKRTRSVHTISIHWYSASWKNDGEQNAHWEMIRNMKKKNQQAKTRQLMYRFVTSFLGEKRYRKIRKLLWRG